MTVRTAPRWSDRTLSLTFTLGHACKINILFNILIPVLKQLLGGTFCSFFFISFSRFLLKLAKEDYLENEFPLNKATPFVRHGVNLDPVCIHIAKHVL